jgi:hypothetical protein
MMSLAIYQLKWTKKSIVCKNLLNLITINNNLPRLDKQESYFGFGKIMKEALSFILLKFRPKKP